MNAPASGMNRITNEHQRRNRTTRSFWNEYAVHREMVTRCLLQSAPNADVRRSTASQTFSSLALDGNVTICLLGAGNCNDVDLSLLANVYEKIHLVDADAEALAYAAEIASARVRDHLVVHPSIDASGVASDLARWTERLPQPSDFQDLVIAAQTAELSLESERFDVVASCCLLSQLVDSLVLTGVPHDSQFLELLFAIRDRHLEIVWQWTKPGGAAVVISDFVSTVTLPQLMTWNATQLAAAFPQLIEQRNFFTGMNPSAIRDKLSRLNAVESEPEISAPWIWTVGERKFGVCAVTACRNA